MIVPYLELLSTGHVFCLPEQVKLKPGALWSNLCALKAGNGPIILKAVQARPFLEKGYMAVDDNGIFLTSLDPDLDKKLVVIDDLNLYFALQQDSSCFEDVRVEILSKFPKGRKWYY